MVYKADYPTVDSLGGFGSSFDMLENVMSYPILEQYLDNNIIRICTYRKSFWGKKKELDVTIQRIIDADEATKTYDGHSSGKIFGIIITQGNKEIFRSLSDTGVLSNVALSMRKFHVANKIQYLTDGNLKIQPYLSGRIELMKNLEELAESIEELFK